MIGNEMGLLDLETRHPLFRLCEFNFSWLVGGDKMIDCVLVFIYELIKGLL